MLRRGVEVLTRAEPDAGARAPSSEFGSFQRFVDLGVVVALSAASVLAIVTGYGFSGDALIHITFMDNAAAGRWFEFNPGVPDPSSTSVLWTALGAMLWRLGGGQLTALGIKALGFACVGLNGWLIFRLARNLGGSPALARATTAAVLVIPSTLLNSVQGMENVMFASFVLGALTLFSRQLRNRRLDAPRTVVLFALLGLSCATRPEGAALSAAFGLVWLVHALRTERERAPTLLFLAAAVALFLAVPLWLFSALKTGYWLPTSGVSRVMYARRDPYTILLGPLWVYGRAAAFLAAYAPLSLLALIGFRAGLRGGADPACRGSLVALGAVTAAGLFVYTFVTGAAHASRYLIWTFPLIGLAASRGAQELLAPRHGWRGPAILLASAAWVASVAGAEAFLRARSGLFDPNWAYSIDTVSNAPERRRERTEALLSRICAFGCCERVARPAIAAVEVQRRYFLDERIDVLSMDGVTVGPFHRQMEYEPDGCPRLESIREDTSIVALLDSPAHRGVKLDRCLRSEWSRRIADAWEAESSIPGWVYGTRPEMLIRDCRVEGAANEPAGDRPGRPRR